MDARDRVVGALESLWLSLPELEGSLSPARWSSLRDELLPFLDEIERCRADDDWQRLRSKIDAFGTRHGVRGIIDQQHPHPNDDRSVVMNPRGADLRNPGHADMRNPHAAQLERGARSGPD